MDHKRFIVSPIYDSETLGYLRLEHSKLRGEIAAPLTRLLTAATEGNKVKKL